MNKKVPKEHINVEGEISKSALFVIESLQNAGYEAYLVGGCVRDILMGRKPKDWDVTTNAHPEEIIATFEDTYYENRFGTVGVKVSEEIVEVTPYREEGVYSDARRPDTVSFSKKIEDDLKRRDFTINAIAYDPISAEFIDLFEGIKDIKNKTVRAVGDAKERFSEDGLRILRAVRFATELGFMINKDTENALIDSHETLGKIAFERIRDEFNKILLSDTPMVGVFMCNKLGLLKYFAKELEEGVGIDQNQAHSFTVFEHLLRSLQHAADKRYSLEVRLAALFHDIGKPRSRRFSTEKKDYTFYGHEVIGAEMTRKILERLKYPKKTVDLVYKFVRWHMFFSDTEQISLSAVRRMVANVGKEHIWDLMNLRICDRIGTGRPKEDPYRLRKYHSMIDQVLADPISVSMLKIDGNTLMDELHVEPGPRIGFILNAILEEVIENPALNTKEHLLKRAFELNGMDSDELKSRAESGKRARELKEKELIQAINKKHKV